MKNITILFAIILCATSLTAQEQEYQEILQTDSTWGHEFFEFPIGFAQEIDYQGLEDATFPRGWSDQESDEFWSYVFAWDIKISNTLTSQQLERDLELYFDGLMKLNHENKGNTEVEKSTVTLHKSSNTSGPTKYRGTIYSLNAFHTQKAFTLNVTVDQHLCTDKERSVIIFRFSPQDFSEEIWKKLNGVKRNIEMCRVVK